MQATDYGTWLRETQDVPRLRVTDMELLTADEVAHMLSETPAGDDLGDAPCPPWAAAKVAYKAQRLWDGALELDHAIVSNSRHGAGHEWHCDSVKLQPGPPQPNHTPNRVLSATVALTPPEAYEGGVFEFRDPAESFRWNVGRGAVFCSNGSNPHRVTPVTRGTRRQLVLWLRSPRVLPQVGQRGGSRRPALVAAFVVVVVVLVAAVLVAVLAAVLAAVLRARVR